MSIFNTGENIEKVKFGDVFNVIKLICGYRYTYISTGLFFAEPEGSNDLNQLIRIPLGRDPLKDLNKEGDDCIRCLLEKLQNLDEFPINTNQNIPIQLLKYFNNSYISSAEADPFFMKLNNAANNTFYDIAAQYELRARCGAPGFNDIKRCGYIHLIFHTKLLHSYKNGLDSLHWFIPVELKEGWG